MCIPLNHIQANKFCSQNMWIFSPEDNYLFISPPNEPKQNLFQSSTRRMLKAQINSLWDPFFLLFAGSTWQADGDHGPFCRFLTRLRVCSACSLVHGEQNKADLVALGCSWLFPNTLHLSSKGLAFYCCYRWTARQTFKFWSYNFILSEANFLLAPAGVLKILGSFAWLNSE